MRSTVTRTPTNTMQKRDGLLCGLPARSPSETSGGNACERSKSLRRSTRCLAGLVDTAAGRFLFVSTDCCCDVELSEGLNQGQEQDQRCWGPAAVVTIPNFMPHTHLSVLSPSHLELADMTILQRNSWNHKQKKCALLTPSVLTLVVNGAIQMNSARNTGNTDPVAVSTFSRVLIHFATRS